ncbi:hypothetical protein HOP50_18g81870 [Chloropicon primus]|nr:hypothetical protein HOP50_18g81870 [Chloropicon primus]
MAMEGEGGYGGFDRLTGASMEVVRVLLAMDNLRERAFAFSKRGQEAERLSLELEVDGGGQSSIGIGASLQVRFTVSWFGRGQLELFDHHAPRECVGALVSSLEAALARAAAAIGPCSPPPPQADRVVIQYLNHGMTTSERMHRVPTIIDPKVKHKFFFSTDSWDYEGAPGSLVCARASVDFGPGWFPEGCSDWVQWLGRVSQGLEKSVRLCGRLGLGPHVAEVLGATRSGTDLRACIAFKRGGSGPEGSGGEAERRFCVLGYRDPCKGVTTILLEKESAASLGRGQCGRLGSLAYAMDATWREGDGECGVFLHHEQVPLRAAAGECPAGLALLLHSWEVKHCGSRLRLALADDDLLGEMVKVALAHAKESITARGRGDRKAEVHQGPMTADAFKSALLAGCLAGILSSAQSVAEAGNDMVLLDLVSGLRQRLSL